MANITKGAAPQPYGRDGRKVFLPVKATQQVYQGGMAAQISGACVPGTTAGAGRCIGVFESDALGGASDGTVRVSVWTDKVFIFKAGTNAPTDATPFGTPLYMEDDNSVGTGGVLGTGEGLAGLFVGMEDDGQVRVFIGVLAADQLDAVTGATLIDQAADSVVVKGRMTRYSLPAVISQNVTVTLATTGAVVGDVIKILSPGTSAHTVAVANGGAGAGTLNTIGSAKVGWVQAYFDGTNWIYDGSSVA